MHHSHADAVALAHEAALEQQQEEAEDDRKDASASADQDERHQLDSAQNLNNEDY